MNDICRGLDELEERGSNKAGACRFSSWISVAWMAFAQLQTWQPSQSQCSIVRGMVCGCSSGWAAMGQLPSR